MTSINRATLPSNFVDSVNQMGLSLPTPEPQYLFAQWAMAGRLSLAALNAGAPTVQQFVSMAGGGDMVDPDLARLVRVADNYPGMVTAVDAFGLGRGDTIKFQRPVYSTGGLTESARELVTDGSISTTGVAIQAEEIPVVLKQYHGPYTSTGSAVAPYAIYDFDAKYRANKLQLAGLVSKHLQHDYVKWLDTVIRLRAQASTYITLSDPDFADVTSYVAGGGATTSLDQWLRARKTLTDREWQPFPNGRYVAIVPTSFNTQMLGDVEYRELSRNHTDGRNQIFGYIGSAQDIDFFECSTTTSYAAASTVTGTGGGTVPASVTLNEGLLLGPGALGFGTAAAPQCRWADDTNYGTVAKVIWYALHAFQTLDERGIQRVIYQTA